MNKGTRVRICSGRDSGKTGEVFWTGKDRYGDGLRLGIRGDDGETYWISEGEVETTDAPPPPVEAGPTFDKNDRVRFRRRGQEGTGTVFWIGESRQGPGQRLGIRDDANPDDAVWLDARFAEKLEGEEAAPAPQHRSGDAVPAEYSSSLRLDELPPMAPIDDSYADQMAASCDDDGPEEIPHDW